MDNIVTQSEIVSNVITNLIEDSVKNAWEKTRVFFKNLKDTEAIRYKTAYETYLIIQGGRIVKLKPLYTEGHLKIFIHFMNV